MISSETPDGALPEDDFRFARRRASEGAKDESLLAELAQRGVDPELREQLVRGVRSEKKRRVSIAAVAFGAAILVLGVVLFIGNARLASQGEVVSYRLATLVCLAGGALIAKGMFG